MGTNTSNTISSVVREIAIPRYHATRNVLFVLALVLAGCAVGPDYVRPTLTVPTAWRDQQATDSSIAGRPYAELYGDAVLQDMIRAALDSNLDLRVALARIKEATAQLTFSKADLYPALGLQGSGGAFELSRNRYPGFSPELLAGVRGAFGLNAVLSWELDVFGRIRRSNEAQQALLAASEQGQRAAVVTVVAAVASRYIDLREFDRLAEILDSNVQTRREYLKLARTLFEGGKTSELDFRQAEAELARVEAQLPIVRTAVAQTENALNVLMGRPPGSAIARGLTLEGQPLPTETPAGIPSALLERRPDVRVAEEALHAENAQIGAAVAQLFPRFSIIGEGGLQSLHADNLFNANSLAWQAAGNFTQPLFAFGKNLARIDASEARTEQALYAYRNTVLVAFQEVNDALVAYNNSSDRVLATTASVNATREALRLSELRYRYGTTPYLQVLDAQRSLLAAQSDDVSARSDRLRQLVFLYRALGGGY